MVLFPFLFAVSSSRLFLFWFDILNNYHHSFETQIHALQLNLHCRKLYGSQMTWIWQTDKASLLVSTINYLKELVTKVKSLEESIIDGPVESAILMKDDKASLITNESSSSDPLFKIEAKLTGNIIVLKFQCKNLKGLAIKALSEIEKLFLTIIDLSIMPFSSSSLDVVVMAKVSCFYTLSTIILDLSEIKLVNILHWTFCLKLHMIIENLLERLFF